MLVTDHAVLSLPQIVIVVGRLVTIEKSLRCVQISLALLPLLLRLSIRERLLWIGFCVVIEIAVAIDVLLVLATILLLMLLFVLAPVVFLFLMAGVVVLDEVGVRAGAFVVGWWW